MGSEHSNGVPDNRRGRKAQHLQPQVTTVRSPEPLPLKNQPRRISQPSSSDTIRERNKVEKVEGDDTEQSSVQNSGILDVAKDVDKNKAFPTRTYHTIKDMISSRFGSGKAPKDGTGNGEACSTSGAEAENKACESGHTAVALNNSHGANGEEARKGVNDSSQSITCGGQVGASSQNGDAAVDISNSEELEVSQKQHVFEGGLQQMVGLSRTYNGEIIGGTFHNHHIAVRRPGTGDIPPGMGGDGESVQQRNLRGPQGACLDQQGLYAMAQYDRGMELPVNRELLPPQAREPPYGPQRSQSRPPQGMLDQNGMYIVMQQNGQSYQHAVPVGSVESQCGFKEQEPDMRRHNIAGVLSFQHTEGSQPLTDGSAVSKYGTKNMVGGLVKRDTGGNHSHRGSQLRLDEDDDEDDDEGGFVVSGSKGSSGTNNLRDSCHSAGGESFTKATGSGNYNQQQSSGQSSDYEKATQRSIGQSSSNADSGRGSTVYSGGHQVTQGGVRGEASEQLDTSTESSDSPQAISGHREGIYGSPVTLAAG
jgi:hypothetical protein